VETARKDTVLQRLRNIPFFDTLPADQLARLAEAAAVRAIRAREVLYEQNDPAHSCFAILSGTLRFSVRLGRQQATSGLASAHDVFGLESLQLQARRPDTAIAGAPSEVAEIDAARLRELMLENPRFQFVLLNYVVLKLQEKSSHAVQTGHYDAEQRLASYLIEHCGDGLRDFREGVVVSQADLADYLALTPETLCRKVGKFRKLGWIGGRGNDYVIKKPAALQQLLER
jgi:CRP-like cAMP-binding protein